MNNARCSKCSSYILDEDTISNEKLCKRCENSNDLKETNPIKALFYIIEGIPFLFKNTKILKLSIIPVLLSLILLIASISFSVYLFFNNVITLFDFQILGTFGKILEFVFSFIGPFIIIIISLFMFLPIASLICIPFNDFISLEVEEKLLGSKEKDKVDISIYQEVMLTIKEVLKLLILKIIIVIFAIPLNFIPVIGNISFIFVLALITSIDFLDVIMARKKFTFSEKKNFVKKNFVSYIFFSIPLVLLFWVPIVQLLIIPAATVGGTKFFLEGKK